MLSIAGLWDEWTDPASSEVIRSCTMIITNANEALQSIHDRMPVLLTREDIDAWLSGAAGTELLRPTPAGMLQSWPVSKRVNRPGSDDDASLLEPLVA